MATDYDPTDLTAERERTAEEAKQADQKRQQESADWQFLLGDARGRRIVWGLLEKAGVFRVSFSSDALQMAFNEGQRNLGLGTLALVFEHAPKAFALMQAEAK